MGVIGESGKAILILVGFAVAGLAAWTVILMVVGYLLGLAVLALRILTASSVPGYGAGAEEPAYRHYFFGPVLTDLVSALLAVWDWDSERLRDEFRRARDTMNLDPGAEIRDGLRWLLGLLLLAGLVIGAATGAALTVILLALCPVLEILGIWGLARTGILVLRAFDTLALRARGVRGMQCPHCYEVNAYPVYHCPGGAGGPCDRTHRDIRPGKYGVLRRRCLCGRRLPTTVLTGSHRLPAYCRHCGRQMCDDTGRYRELTLPLIGGVKAGKTRLMAAALLSLAQAAEAAPDRGNTVRSPARPANNETRHAYEVLATVLDDNGHIRATRTELPQAHSVLVRLGRRTLLVHLFDPSGELLSSRERADALRYQSRARTFIFVLDPFSVPGFRQLLTAAESEALDWTLASSVHPEDAFRATFLDTLEKGAPRRRPRLAVAISKTDITAATGALTVSEHDSQEQVRAWLHELGLGNLIRCLDRHFGEVRFFFTAAVTISPGRVHESTTALVSWLLSTPGL